MIPVEVKRLQDILASFLGKPKNDVNDNYQLQFACPRCIEERGEEHRNKFNLEVNLKKNVFKCWCCSAEDNEMQGSIKKLIKKYGSPAILKEYEDALRDIIDSHLYELQDFKDGLENASIEQLKLPETYTKVGNLDSCSNKKVKEYLKKRHFTQEIIDKYNIGYTTWDEPSFADRQRIIIPSYDSYGDLNYWVGRDYSGYDKKTKYKNCLADKKQIIFQEKEIQWDAPIILVEGAIDCLYYTGNAVSLLGKTLSRDSLLYQKLMKQANSDIIICLDADTNMDEVKRLYALLDIGRLKDKIYYIRLGEDGINYKDFGEIFEAEGKKGIIRAIKNKKKFKEIDLVI